MSVRDRVEEALAKLALGGRGLAVHFSFGDPVVTDPHGLNPRPEDESARLWAEAQGLARSQFETMLRVADWNRAVLEAVGAYLAMSDEHDVTMFGSDASFSGQALKAALSTRDTMPDWFRARRLDASP